VIDVMDLSGERDWVLYNSCKKFSRKVARAGENGMILLNKSTKTRICTRIEGKIKGAKLAKISQQRDLSHK
jgi:hypothetical protein